MMFNDPMQQNKIMDPMLGPMDQPLRDPVTGQPIFGQQQQQKPAGMLDPMMGPQQMKPPDQFDPITGMPLNQPMDLNKPNQQMIGPPFDQMNAMTNLGQPDPMLGPVKQFNEINNNLLIGDKMKQGAQFPPGAPFAGPAGQPQMPGQPLIDPLSMQNAQLYALENGRLLGLHSCFSTRSWHSILEPFFRIFPSLSFSSFRFASKSK